MTTDTGTRMPFNSRLTDLKIKLLSLAAEARIIADEQERQRRRGRRAAVDHLRQHRVKVVAREARFSLIAYAYLRGMPYLGYTEREGSSGQPDSKQPKHPWKQIDWKYITGVANRFSAPGTPGLSVNDLEQWSVEPAVSRTPVETEADQARAEERMNARRRLKKAAAQTEGIQRNRRLEAMQHLMAETLTETLN